MLCSLAAAHVLGVVAHREHAGVEPRVERLDAPVHHLREAGEVVDRAHRRARLRSARARCHRSRPARSRARRGRGRNRRSRACLTPTAAPGAPARRQAQPRRGSRRFGARFRSGQRSGENSAPGAAVAVGWPDLRGWVVARGAVAGRGWFSTSAPRASTGPLRRGRARPHRRVTRPRPRADGRGRARRGRADRS